MLCCSFINLIQLAPHLIASGSASHSSFGSWSLHCIWKTLWISCLKKERNFESSQIYSISKICGLGTAKHDFTLQVKIVFAQLASMVHQLKNNIVNDPQVRIVESLILLSSSFSSNQLLCKLSSSTTISTISTFSTGSLLKTESNPNPVFVLAIKRLLFQPRPGQIAVNALYSHLSMKKMILKLKT